jgi:hypothetical protein
MASKTRKRNAIHSGIGDNDDLLVKRPVKEDITEDFRYAARLRGKKRHDTMIYPEVPFEYGISYTGQTKEVYNEKEYTFDINAHPEKTIAYRIEQTKELPVERMWEAQACFEGEICRKNMKYALNYKGHTGIKDKRTAEYAVNWKGLYNVADLGDAKDLFTNVRGQYIGYSDGSTGWTMTNNYVADERNRSFFSGTIAKKDAAGNSMYNWNAYEASFTFKPILNDGSGIFGNTKRFNWNTNTFYDAPKWDDDVVGLIFQAKSDNDFYLMLWESDERIWKSSRAASNLDGINIKTMKDEYVDRSVVAAGSPPTRTQWVDYCNNKGWGTNHYRIYKVVDNVMTRVSTPVQGGGGQGWIMNNMHTVRVVTEGKNVKIYAKTSSTGNEFKMFDFDTDWDGGTFGMMNWSQAVQFHSINVIERKILQGRIPESGWDSTTDASKTVASNATTYVKNSASFAAKKPASVAVGSVSIVSITGSIRNADNGSITVNGLTSTIVAKANDYTTWKELSGRLPASGWYEWDGVGDRQLTDNAQKYVREKSGKAELILDQITSTVNDPTQGKVVLNGNTGPVVAHSYNHPDAGKKYSKCYVRCGIVTVTPDNRNYDTGLLVFADIADVFKTDYNEFFKEKPATASDPYSRLWCNKKATYELLKPVKKAPPKPPTDDPDNPSECLPAPPKPPEEEEPVIQCWDDFDFNGKKLIMWSCEFPIEKTEKLFEDGVFAYQGWVTFNPLLTFNSNKWSVYELKPIEATVDPQWDEIKWAGRTELKNAPLGTKVTIRTKEWYKSIFPADIVNKGIVNSDTNIVAEIPPAPEHFWLPTAEDDKDIKNRMPDKFTLIHYLLDAYTNHPDVLMWYESNPSLTTENVSRTPESLAKEGRLGMPIVLTANDIDKVIIHCKEDPRFYAWSSGKYIGYGKVNGKRPFFGNGSGKADMVNVSTEVVFFPPNFVPESLEGPFIDIYDKEFPKFPRIKYKLHSDGKLVDFYSDHMDAYIWYTDWYSNWVEEEGTFQATMQDVTEIKTLLDLDPTDPIVSPDYNPDNTTIERIEVTSNNPFVKLWIEEDKGKHSGLLGTYYRFPLSSNIYEEQFQVAGDYEEWTQNYTIPSYMDRVEIPVNSEKPFKVLTVTVGGSLIPNSASNGYTLEDGVVKLHGTAIRAGEMVITFSTGDINNVFYLEDNLGDVIEVYVNGVLIDSSKYSFDGRNMTVSKDVLYLNDWVNIQSYEMNELFDPTRRNYLGEKQYTQLDFQEDIPSAPTNPNYNDMYYEGSFCFNWGYQAPDRLLSGSVNTADFTPKYWYSDKMNFKFNVDMAIVHPVGTPIDITNFTGEWKQWDQQSIIPPGETLQTQTGNGPGNWHGPPEEGYPEVTNLRNQNSRSGWYNPAHKDLTDYDFRFKVSARKGDDDMYGAIFKFDPVTQNFYSFEWDGYWGMNPPSGGTGVKGMAIYKNICKNPELAGTGDLQYTTTLLARADISWKPGTAEVNEIRISTIGDSIKVWTNGVLRFDIKDKSNPFLKGAWGPVTASQPDTYFWDFWMQTYKRVTWKDQATFRKPHEITKDRPAIVDSPLIEMELDQKDMEAKFGSEINAFVLNVGIPRNEFKSIEFTISEDTSDYPVYFKEFQTIRVLELTPDNLAPNPLGKSSIQQAVERFGSFDPSKKIVITQDIYSNWNKYKIAEFDVLTFTPADCNARFDIVSDGMEQFVRDFKNSTDKVVIFTHDTGVLTPRMMKLLTEFGFTLTSGVTYTAHNVITRVDNSFNYPYDLAGDVPISTSHWNQVAGTTPIYMFQGQDKAWLSYIDNVYYSEAGHTLYDCSGGFKQQLSDNEMKIWINLICRIAQWEAGAKPTMTKFAQSKLYATVRGQNPPAGEPVNKPVPTPAEPEIPLLTPPTELNPKDGFTISWNGYIYAPESGVYRFKATANDGFRLWVRNTEIIKEWHVTGDPNYFPDYEGSIYLDGGKWHPITAHYFDNVGQALIRLHWAQPGKQFKRISPNYLTPYLGYRLFAQVKKARPLPWNPLIHNGYFYHEERENYLYAEKKVLKRTPDAFHEIMIEPRPQQGSAIIVRDNQGSNLRKVTFYDDNWNLTLENKEEFNGNGFAKYFLNYKGIDKATLKVKLNGTALMNADYIFNEEESSIEFMDKVNFEDSIEVKYKLLYSYMIDMNADIVDGFVNKDAARITLHSNYDPAKMSNMEIIYEAAKETPFYRATEAVFNPILNHNHTGFLYIAETQEQDVKDMNVYLSDKTLSNTGREKVLLTARVIDKYNNPVPKKLVSIKRDGILIGNLTTNEAGEVYLYDKPVPVDGLISTYQVESEGIIKEALLNYYVDGEPKRMYLDVVAPKLSVFGGVDDVSVITATLRDESWNPLGSGHNIYVEKRDSYNVKTTETLVTDSFGQVRISVSGLTETHGNVVVKVSYDMGFEDTANIVELKVIGG